MKFGKLLAALAGCVLVFGAHVHADSSQRPIRIVVPYAAGGPTDNHARALADDMSKSLSQTVIVENRPGASGLLATR